MAMTSRGPAVSLTAAASLGIATFFTLYSLIPVTRADDPHLSSLFVGTMMAFVMGVQVFTPALVRRFSLRRTMMAASVMLALGAFITGWAPTTLVLLVGAVASGAAFGTLVVAGAQGMALLVPAERLGRALGTYGLVTMAASALGSPAGVQLALTFSPTVFGVCALVAGVLAVGLAVGIPGSVGMCRGPLVVEAGVGGGADDGPTAGTSSPRAVIASAPWLAIALLLLSVVLLSHGLTSLPVLASAFGSAAAVVFAVQVGNALGRGIGGELEARLSTRAAVAAGVALLAVGGTLGVLIDAIAAALVAGALVGLGVGIVQSVTLHVAMQRMDPGHASVVWNLGVDGGLWTGGILWGLMLSLDLVEPAALAFSAAIVVVGAVVAVRSGAGRPDHPEAARR